MASLLKSPTRDKKWVRTNGGAYADVDAPGPGPGEEPLARAPKTIGELVALLKEIPTDIERYVALANLQASNTNLYYAGLVAHTREVMPLVYTPTVGAACQAFSALWPRLPQDGCLFLSMADDTTAIHTKLPNSPIKAIVVTDGERILGLGDLGANGMGIPIGKMALYAGLGGLQPEECLPVTLDCGTNTDGVKQFPGYIGSRLPRAAPDTPELEMYDAFVAEFVEAARAKYGKNVMIQWEDFGNANAFRILERYGNSCCCFNDDIQGTASVCLAGFLAASPKLTGRQLSDEVVLFNGAGEAGCGIAMLLATAISREKGCTVAEARAQIWLFDSRGLVVEGRSTGGIAHHKAPFAHAIEGEAPTTLLAAAQLIKPTALVGVSAQPGTFTAELLQYVASYCEAPLIFPLSNPTSKAECSAEEAYRHTGGKAIVATGSPFDPVTLASGDVREPGQGNNVYIFPGVGLGATLMAKIGGLGSSLADRDIVIDDEDMYRAASTCASMVSEQQLAKGNVYPPVSQLRDVAAAIAAGFIQRRAPDTTMTLAECKAAMYDPMAEL